MQDILLKSIFVVLLFLSSCSSREAGFNLNNFGSSEPQSKVNGIIPGAERLAKYLPLLKNKKIAMAINHTSMVEEVHLVDTLQTLGVDIKVIFAPEHGFRGTADAGEKVQDGIDPSSNVPVISLYGKKRRPEPKDLIDVDLMIFDVQEVGARFYTYVSTLSYIMESCAENGIPLLVLDRPNPNGFYVDGPILEPEYSSFIGLHEIPVVHGMTIGEYSMMVNGESWLTNGIKCELTVIACKNYDHTMTYDLPIKPSPNLPNHRSILLYPSLCFFEGTTVSVGRGTESPFEHIGHPKLKTKSHFFVPQSMSGAKYPKHENITCFGDDFKHQTVNELKAKARLDLSPIIEYFQLISELGETYFLENLFFDKLAGTAELRNQILNGMSEDEIRLSWQSGIDEFKVIRRKYLLYPDFE